MSQSPLPLSRRAALGSVMAGAIVGPSALAQQSPAVVPVTIDLRAATGSLPHIWAECAGSDRAAITLRETWRKDLDRWVNEAGLKRVRFHGIFNDELGVFAPSIQSPTETPNFHNIDEVYDGLLAHGASPFIELSFMPKRLASGDRAFGFYSGNITPPKSDEAWAGFVRDFAIHLIDRYGLAKVKTWPFEVWNEANLGFFWSGTQQQYFDMYKATAVALKTIDPGLMVGGPSTSAAQWLPEFAQFCIQNNAPLDFISTHVYAGDRQQQLFGDDHYPQADVIPEAMRRARQKLDATTLRGLPLWLTEWSCDSPAMIAHVIAGCLPHCQAMSHWTLSGTYEELGVAEFILKEGDMGYSAMTHGIAKASFNTYKLLHALGGRRVLADGPALASKHTNGAVAALVWNLADVQQASGIPGRSHTRAVSGEPKRLQISFAGARKGQRVRIRFVDQERGSPMPAWREMGSPRYLTTEQIALLHQRAEIPNAVSAKLDDASQIALDLPAEGVALIEFA